MILISAELQQNHKNSHSCFLLKRGLCHRCFPVNFAKFLRTSPGDCFLKKKVVTAIILLIPWMHQKNLSNVFDGSEGIIDTIKCGVYLHLFQHVTWLIILPGLAQILCLVLLTYKFTFILVKTIRKRMKNKEGVRAMFLASSQVTNSRRCSGKQLLHFTLCEKCPYSEFFFWFVFSLIRTEYGETKYSISLRIHSECGKIRTRKTPNTDTFYPVLPSASYCLGKIA